MPGFDYLQLLGLERDNGLLWDATADQPIGGALTSFERTSVAAAIKLLFGPSNVYRPRQTPTKCDPCDVWAPGRTYVQGDRILPTAYNAASTWTFGFVSPGGRLYQLVCVVGGLNGFIEPTWKDPSAITNYSFNNVGTGPTQLDIVDGGVTWRIRPIAFIDPTYTGGLNNGSQLRPYTNYNEINATTGTAWGTVATDLDNTGAGQVYASLMVMQRAGTTITGPMPIIDVRGPSNGTPNALQRYVAGFVNNASHQMRKRIYGAYRRPGDPLIKPRLIGNEPKNTNGTAPIANTKLSVVIQDFTLSNLREGANGYGLFQLWEAPSYGLDVVIRRVDVAGTRAGSGFVATTFGGDSNNPGTGNLLYQDCNAWACAGHGFIASNSLQVPTIMSFDSIMPTFAVRYERCAAWDIGRDDTLQAYNHGFSSIAARLFLGNGINTGLIGWTLVSGTIYNRLIAGLVPVPGTMATISEIWGVAFRSEFGVFPGNLRKNTSTPATPGIGEFGVSGGNLFINLGAPLDERLQFNVQISKCQDIQYEDCEAYDVKSWRGQGELAVPFPVEGYGFAADEWSVATWLNCVAHHNEKAGVFVNSGIGSNWIGGQLTDNGESGAYTSLGVNFGVSGADIQRNGFTGVLSFFGANQTKIERNNIGFSPYGVVYLDNPVRPPFAFPNNLFPYNSSVIGLGNTYAEVKVPVAIESLVRTYSPAPTFPGDWVK